jgi:hypothetical protein
LGTFARQTYRLVRSTIDRHLTVSFADDRVALPVAGAASPVNNLRMLLNPDTPNDLSPSVAFGAIAFLALLPATQSVGAESFEAPRRRL